MPTIHEEEWLDFDEEGDDGITMKRKGGMVTRNDDDDASSVKCNTCKRNRAELVVIRTASHLILSYLILNQKST